MSVTQPLLFVTSQHVGVNPMVDYVGVLVRPGGEFGMSLERKLELHHCAITRIICFICLLSHFCSTGWFFARLVQRAAVVESKNIFGESFMAKAFDTNVGSLVEAAEECAWEVLDHHQVQNKFAR